MNSPSFNPGIEPAQFQNIVVFDTGSLADVVESLPAVKALRQHFSRSTLTIVAGAVQGEVLKFAECADKIIVQDHYELVKGDKVTAGWNLISAGARLGVGKYDLAIDLNEFSESGVLAWLSRATSRIGVRHQSKLAKWLFNIRNPRVSRPRRKVDQYAEAIEAIGVQVIDRSIRLPIAGKFDTAIQKRLKRSPWNPGELLVGLYPETSGTQSAWPASRFAEVAGLLVNHYNARIALVGEAKNSPVIKDVAAKLRNEYQHEVVMLAGIPVAEQIAGLACCTLMATAEAGWARLSAAVDTPTVLLTDTRDEHLDPESPGQRHHFLYQPQLEAISTDQVFDVICGMLRTSRTGALFDR